MSAAGGLSDVVRREEETKEWATEGGEEEEESMEAPCAVNPLMRRRKRGRRVGRVQDECGEERGGEDECGEERGRLGRVYGGRGGEDECGEERGRLGRVYGGRGGEDDRSSSSIPNLS